VADRLRPVGFCLTDDGGTVRLWPLPGTPTEVVRTLTAAEEEVDPSAEQLEILSIVAFFGQAGCSLIERCRGDEDSAPLLDRMTRRGLPAKVRSERGAGGPNVYRITTKALRAAGFATVEAMRTAVSGQVEAAHLTLLAKQLSPTSARPATETAPEGL
jgi:chromosome segregation and condensation protein ScpB